MYVAGGGALRLGEGFELAVAAAVVLAGVVGGGGGGVGGGACGVERCDGAVSVLLPEVGGGDASGERAGVGGGGGVDVNVECGGGSVAAPR